MKPKGWRGESRRHSMARKGITTAQGKPRVKKFKSHVTYQTAYDVVVDDFGVVDNKLTFRKNPIEWAEMYGDYRIEWEVFDKDGEVIAVEVIGIWVDGDKVVDYDGVMDIPEEAIKLLKERGFDTSSIEYKASGKPFHRGYPLLDKFISDLTPEEQADYFESARKGGHSKMDLEESLRKSGWNADGKSWATGDPAFDKDFIEMQEQKADKQGENIVKARRGQIKGRKTYKIGDKTRKAKDKGHGVYLGLQKAYRGIGNMHGEDGNYVASFRYFDHSDGHVREDEYEIDKKGNYKYIKSVDLGKAT